MNIDSIIEKYFLSNKLSLKILAVFFLAIFSQSLAVSSKPYSYFVLEAISKECFYSKNLEQCLIAIKKAEELQSIASFQGNYSCQTRILGFQSKLIMLMLDFPAGRSYLRDLNDAKEVCRGIF